MSLQRLLNQRAMVFKRIGYDDEGKSVHGEKGECVACRIELNKQFIASVDGNDTFAGLRMFVGANVKIEPDDKIKFGDKVLYAQRVDNIIDGRGNIHHREVFL